MSRGLAALLSFWLALLASSSGSQQKRDRAAIISSRAIFESARYPYYEFPRERGASVSDTMITMMDRHEENVLGLCSTKEFLSLVPEIAELKNVPSKPSLPFLPALGNCFHSTD